jgi:hypothetical protein
MSQYEQNIVIKNVQTKLTKGGKDGEHVILNFSRESQRRIHLFQLSREIMKH